MNETETMIENPPDQIAPGFRISDQPVVESRKREEQPPASADRSGLGELPAFYGGDLLYVIARDPKSLFVYWDLDWARLFGEAGLTPRPVHLRVLREDGSEEGTSEIDPLRGYCFVEVATPGASYSCELGCFEGSDWKSLIRSGSTPTPEAEMSEDLEADFATLPFHLSFQRLVDIFRAKGPERGTLARSVAEMQNKVRGLQKTMPSGDWSKLVDAAAALVDAEAGLGLVGVQPAEFSALLRADQSNGNRTAPSPEMLTRWRELGERFGGSSWGGASPGGASWGGAS